MHFVCQKINNIKIKLGKFKNTVFLTDSVVRSVIRLSPFSLLSAYFFLEYCNLQFFKTLKIAHISSSPLLLLMSLFYSGMSVKIHRCCSVLRFFQIKRRSKGRPIGIWWSTWYLSICNNEIYSHFNKIYTI